MNAIDDSSVASLRAAIDERQDLFVQAIEAACPRWNEEILPPEVPERSRPMQTTWTPRQACWHVLSTRWWMQSVALEHVRRAQEHEPALLRDTFGDNWWPNHTVELDELRNALAEPAEGVALAHERLAAFSDALESVTDVDLEAPWEPSRSTASYLASFGGEETPNTVRGLLTLTALHLADHAEQIASKV